MTRSLRDGLHEIADAAPRLALPADLYRRARRAHRRRRVVGTAAALMVAAAVAVGVYAQPEPAVVAPADAPGARLPSTVVAPPGHTASISAAPVSRALVMYAGDETTHTEGLLGDEYPLVVVGPDDAYRSYDRPEWTSSSPQLPTFLLSPDGRHVLMNDTGTGEAPPSSYLLSVDTASVRVLTWGSPVAWSPDGRLAAFVSRDAGGDRYDVVSLPSNTLVGSGRLAADPAVAENLTAAFSADGSLCVLNDSELQILRHNGTAWQLEVDRRDSAVYGLRLAGPAAWTPDGGQIIATSLSGSMVRVSASDGRISAGPPLATLGQQPLDAPGDQLVGWRGDTPIVVSGNRVILLSQPARTLITAPAGVVDLQLAAALLTEPLRTPGPPDPGPFSLRYRSEIVAGGGGVVLVIGAALLIWRRVRKTRRARLASL